MQICDAFALCCRTKFALPRLKKLEDLSLDLPYLDSSIQHLSEFANLKAISLSCETYFGEIDELLYWPKLENLHIVALDGKDLVSSTCKVTQLACLRPGLKSEALLKCLSASCPRIGSHTPGAVAVLSKEAS